MTQRLHKRQMEPVGQFESMNSNPYAPSLIDPPEQKEIVGDVRQIRRDYLGAEQSLRSLGSVYYLIATWAVVATLSGLSNTSNTWAVLAYGLLIGATSWVVGWTLRRLDGRLRLLAAMPPLVLCLKSPLGIPFAVLALWILLRPASRRVTTQQYRQVVSETRSQSPRWSQVYLTTLSLCLLLSLGVGAWLLEQTPIGKYVSW